MKKICFNDSNAYAVDSKRAYTLAEVLITLGIIGVVAAMTLPALISKYREKAMVVRLKQTYSIFSQAFLRAKLDNGPAEYWDIGEKNSIEGAAKLYDILTTYLSKSSDCRENYGCFADSYKTLSGTSYSYAPREHSMYARGVLANGVSFAMPSSGSGCTSESGNVSNICAPMYVDLNGVKLPNQAGVDYFGFFILKDKIIPMGLQGWDGGSNGYTCEYKGTSNGNGTGCTAWVLVKENMDYLRRDISDEWK